MPHRCRHSSATSSCRICTRPLTLQDNACSTDIFTPQPSQVVGISNGEWLYRRRTLSLHSSADRPVPFNRLGNTDSHAPAAQFRLSLLTTEGLSRPRASRKSCSSMSRDLLAACPASVAHVRCVPRSNLVSRHMRDTVRWRVAASEAEWTPWAVSTGLRIASPPCLTPWVRIWWYLPSISDSGIPRRAGRKLVQISASSGAKNGAVSATTCWTYCHSFCKQKVKPAYAVWG